MTIKNGMKKLAIAIGLAGALVMPAKQVSAQIPVTDVAHIAESVLSYIQIVEQYENMIQRYQIMFSRYQDLTSVSGIGTAAREILRASRNDIFPDQPPSSIYANPKFPVSSLGFVPGSDAQVDYQARETYIYDTLKDINEMYAELKERRDGLEALQNQINSANSEKRVLDLTALIAAENGLIMNDLAMIQMLQMSMRISEQALEHDEAGRRIANMRDPSTLE